MKKESVIVSLLLLFFIIAVVLSSLKVARPSGSSRLPKDTLLNQEGIALIQVQGPIGSRQSASIVGDEGIDGIISELYAIEEDTSIKAVVLRINSGGGAVGSSQELYTEIIKFKHRTGLPVVASIADVGASGAYWVAMGADTIFSNPGALVGNIGVIIRSFDLTELGEKYGLRLNTYKSGQFKDTLSSWRKSTAEERDLINGMIQNVHNQFINVLAESRNLSLSEARKLADGRIFSGEQALKAKLVDQLGGLRDALEYARQEAGLSKDYDIVERNAVPNFQRLMRYFKNELSWVPQLQLPSGLE